MQDTLNVLISPLSTTEDGSKRKDPGRREEGCGAQSSGAGPSSEGSPQLTKSSGSVSERGSPGQAFNSITETMRRKEENGSLAAFIGKEPNPIYKQTGAIDTY